MDHTQQYTEQPKLAQFPHPQRTHEIQKRTQAYIPRKSRHTRVHKQSARRERARTEEQPSRALPEEPRAPQRAASTLAREEEEGERQRIQQPTPAEPLRPPVPFSPSGLAFRRSAELPTPIASPSNRQAHRNNQHTGQEIERRRLGIGTGGRREEGAGRRGRGGNCEESGRGSGERGAMGGNSSRKGALKQRRVGPIRCGPEHADRQAGPSGSGALL